MPGSPGLNPFRRNYETGGYVADLLKDISGIHLLLNRFADLVAEYFLKLLADDKNYFAETGAQRVKNSVINDDFAARPNWVYLLEAAVAAANPGSHNNKSGFLVRHRVLKVDHAVFMASLFSSKDHAVGF